MARAAQTAAQDASTQYQQYAGAALKNYNTQAADTSNDISQLEGSNPYTSKSYLQNQNLLTTGAANAQNTAAKQQLNDAALRTGTNTAALGRTVASNARAGQRTLDAYNAGTATSNVDNTVRLQQAAIGDRQNLANSQAGVLSTTSGAQTNANGQLVNLNGQQDQLWGNVIAGAAGAGGAAIGKI